MPTTLTELHPAQIDQYGVINLQSSGLLSLPEGMAGLVRLRKLNLSRNPKLRSLPAGLDRLESLTELVLRGCDGLQLEHALVVALQQNGCRVTMDMKETARPTLAELQARVTADGVLNLSSSGLESLSEVGELVGLRMLSLYNNPKLTSLPAGLGKLESLAELDLQGCGGLQLEQVPFALQERLCRVTMDMKDAARPTLVELQPSRRELRPMVFSHWLPPGCCRCRMWES